MYCIIIIYVTIQAVIVEKNWKKLLDVYLQSVKVAMKKLKGTYCTCTHVTVGHNMFSTCIV